MSPLEAQRRMEAPTAGEMLRGLSEEIARFQTTLEPAFAGIHKLGEMWNAAWSGDFTRLEQWEALHAREGKPSELAAAERTPAGAESVPAAYYQHAGAETGRQAPRTQPPARERDPRMVKQARDALAAHPDWRQYIQEASAQFHVPSYVLLAFIRMESGFNPGAKAATSRCRGLAQADPRTFAEFKRQTNQPNADPFNPKDAIVFMAWYCDFLIKTVNRTAPQYGFPQNRIAFTQQDIQHLYMAYNNGPAGYVVLRRYLENPSSENFNRLLPFQKRRIGNRPDGENRAAYARHVSVVAMQYKDEPSLA